MEYERSDGTFDMLRRSLNSRAKGLAQKALRRLIRFRQKESIPSATPIVKTMM